ncbi:hypothetical protein QL285_012489 [Trifolium repens]|nr:hypothetical protein QL285_012489 [Trifolium repens]
MLIFQYELNKHRNKTRNQTSYQDNEKYNATFKRQNHNKRTQLKDPIYVKITYLDQKKRKKKKMQRPYESWFRVAMPYKKV